MSLTTRYWAAAMTLATTLAVPLAAQAAEAMRVVRDPVSGELRSPTAAEAAALDQADAALRASRGRTARTGPAEIQHPDGSVETKLDDDTTMYSVVAVGPDGKLNFQCLPGKQAQAFVKSSGKKVKARIAANSAANSATKGTTKEVNHVHP